MIIHGGNADKKMKEMAETDNARAQAKLARRQTQLTEVQIKDVKRAKCISIISLIISGLVLLWSILQPLLKL